ncbi:cytochrome P450 [Myceligenerans indicum]|uniref:Cytochrome P450 n=1 Tax=Myceligenerans indicum TaxID=2593663 RepID=A0ABS1LQS6_9MICO|nr:cytochrome P450 [Myceligenerans indicum]MBL0887882.1 cytochrome P450 [Myceligenerans indicum]
MTDLTPITRTTTAPDPHAVYRGLRDEWGSVAPVELEPGVPAWLVLDHADIVRIARDDKLFSRRSETWNGHERGLLSTGSRLPPMIPASERFSSHFQDGAERARLRAPLDDVFNDLDEAMLGAMLRRTCDHLIDEFAEDGKADVVAQYSAVLPLLAVGQLFGFDFRTGRRVAHLAREVMSPMESNTDVLPELEGILTDHIGARYAAPTNDLTSRLIQHGAFTAPIEVAHSLITVLAGANGPLESWVSSTLLSLLTDRRTPGMVGSGYYGVDQAMEETLWANSPSGNLPPLVATKDLLMGDKYIERGDALVLAVSAASQEIARQNEDAWDRAENRSQLAFGNGPHRCPAPRLARIVTRNAVDTLLKRLDVRLTIDLDEIEWFPSPWERRPMRLPVTFTPPIEVRPHWSDGDAADLSGHSLRT